MRLHITGTALSNSEPRDGMCIDREMAFTMDGGLVLRADVFHLVNPGSQSYMLLPVIPDWGMH